MTIPTNALAVINSGSQFRYPYSKNGLPLTVDYSYGPLVINNGTEGVDDRVWKFYVENDTVKVEPEDGMDLPISLFTLAGITEISGTFSQSGRASVAYVASGVAYVWWYNPLNNAMVHNAFPGISSPKLKLDDPHRMATTKDTNDMLLVYIRDGGLYYRQQRGRFETELLLSSTVVGVGERINRMGMDYSNRLHIEIQL